jgi:hypothetical protein
MPGRAAAAAAACELVCAEKQCHAWQGSSSSSHLSENGKTVPYLAGQQQQQHSSSHCSEHSRGLTAGNPAITWQKVLEFAEQFSSPYLPPSVVQRHRRPRYIQHSVALQMGIHVKDCLTHSDVQQPACRAGNQLST